MLCTCGCTEIHVIAQRRTADDVTLKCWSDGSVTDFFGVVLRGLGKARSKHRQESDVLALRDIMDDLSLYAYAEIVTAIQVARQDRRKHRYTSEEKRRVQVRSEIRKALA